jgi:uncharacterized protein (TIGR00255 family)
MKRPLSMTSFGRGEQGGEQEKWIVELRSVNHRFSDIKIKIPREYAPLEEKIKKIVSASISRGHVEVYVTLSGTNAGSSRLQVNLPLAQDYYACLLKLQETLDLDEPPTLAMLADNRDLITSIEQTADLDQAWASLEKALTEALENSQKMREAEGASLKIELLERLAGLEKTVKEIEAMVPQLLQQKETALQERLKKLLGTVDLDPLRLAQEVAIIADKADITEELVRLKSHADQFRKFLDLDEPVGRQLDFLLQEFLREINTTASKINDPLATHKTVFLKNEVEKMKEQVQNIE